MPEKVNYNPDILTCLANLSSDEVFTPPEIANAMLDMLPQELFRSPETKFLDPGCKSGVFLREIAKRLNEGLKDQIPNLEQRMDHIMKKQLFAIAITQITSLLSRRSVYCTKDASSRFSVAKFDDPAGNIRFRRIEHTWVDGRCVICGASQEVQDRGEELETHAYEFIHMNDNELKELEDMKFDVIIGNPPYQLSDGGNKASAVPIYNYFVEQAMKLNPRYLSMIIPARWFSGGRGLDGFRDRMLNDQRLSFMYDYTDSNDCFFGVDIAGGICYFLWDKNHAGRCTVTTLHDGKETISERVLNEYDIFIRYSAALSIVKKVTSKMIVSLSSRVSSQKPFGLRTYVTPDQKGELTLRYNKGSGPFERRNVTAGIEWVDKWKVILSYLTYDHAGRADKDGRRRVFSTLEVLPPKWVCTETYIVVDVADTREQANNLYNYLKTRFVRFLVSLTTATQHISKTNFMFVPIQDFSKPWTDEELYKKYGLSDDEIVFIESMIRPMDGGADA